LCDDDLAPCSWIYRTPISLSGESSPADLQYTHMGMLAVLPNGSLAAMWQVIH
jgi:hypothetical protein